MSLPDTRNKLDNNRGNIPTFGDIPSKPKKKSKLKTDNSENSEVPVLTLKITGKKPTNGQIFKKLKGYSKTLKRLMKKHQSSSTEEYKLIRQKRKTTEKKAKQKKHEEAKNYRIKNGKAKVKGGNKKKASETKETK